MLKLLAAPLRQALRPPPLPPKLLAAAVLQLFYSSLAKLFWFSQTMFFFFLLDKMCWSTFIALCIVGSWSFLLVSTIPLSLPQFVHPYSG